MKDCVKYDLVVEQTILLGYHYTISAHAKHF